MKKLLLTFSTITMISFSFFGQTNTCTVKISTNETKICSDKSARLQALPSNSVSAANFSETSEVFNFAALDKAKIEQIKPSINGGFLQGIALPIPVSQINKESVLDLNGLKLKNTVVNSGKLNIQLTTNLNQDIKIAFELPNFLINGKPISDVVLIKGIEDAPADSLFTSNIFLDLTNAIADFTGGDPTKYNIIKYKITPSITISTKKFTGKETGNIKVELNNLTFAENISYKWSKNGVPLNQVTPNIDVQEAGKYVVQTTSNCGTVKDSIEITVVEKPSAKLTVAGPTTFCEGKDKVSLTAASNKNFSYAWSNASKDASVSITKSGDYSVTIKNDICVTQSEVVNIKVNPNPVIKLSKKDTTIYKGDIVILKVSGASSYVWNTKSKYDTISIKEAGTYTVVGTNEFGCTSSDSMKLSVKVKTTGITDLASDNFQVYPNPASNNVYISVANFTNTTLRMYDLIGNEVFHQEIKNEVTEVPVNQFAKGMYLVKIENTNANTIESKRFVVE